MTAAGCAATIIYLISYLLSEMALIKSDLASTTKLLNDLSLINYTPPPPEEDIDELFEGYSAEIDKLDLYRLEVERNNAAELSKINDELKSISSQIEADNRSISQADSQTPQPQEIKDSFVNLSTIAGHEFTSCAEILKLSPISPSGYYYIRTSEGSVRIYCDMTRKCGGITGGWGRVYDLNLTDPSVQCPPNFSLVIRTNPVRSCSAGLSVGCSSHILLRTHIEYSKVCGKIIANQIGQTEAFKYSITSNTSNIDTFYLDGVSITHGSPRQHIWSFANARDDGITFPNSSCSCTNPNISSLVPPPPLFVGNNYFCDTAGKTGEQFGLRYLNSVWDGEGCSQLNSCCSFNNPPWFYRELPQSTTDFIEMRLCRDNRPSKFPPGQNYIESVEIYVH